MSMSGICFYYSSCVSLDIALWVKSKMAVFDKIKHNFYEKWYHIRQTIIRYLTLVSIIIFSYTHNLHAGSMDTENLLAIHKPR